MARRKSKNIKLSAGRFIALTMIVIVLVAAVFLYGWFALNKTPMQTVQYIMQLIQGEPQSPNNSEHASSVFDENTVKTVKDGEFSVHFLELGNKYTGDCVYIKAGDVDILIDAGSRTSSIPTIIAYLDTYIEDKKIEYVIATHAHEDHIAGFAGSEKNQSLFRYYECETIIDFPKTESTTKVYQRYVEERTLEVEAGATHYTALECYNNENGAQRTYELTPNTTMTFLYNYFYENDASSENDYSVCTLFTHAGKNYLFTGDLENEGSLKGEEKLVEYNDLPECELYKAGHHASKTSSSSVLLNKIKPKIVCICCCAGNDEYTSKTENQFPTQAFIDRVASYTDAVYVTTMGDVDYLNGDDVAKEYGSFNGTIVALAGETGEIQMFFANNSLKLKDTAWCKARRLLPEAWRGAVA